MAHNQHEIEARKKKAERGWIVEPPPPPHPDFIPDEENKWRIMMGARYLLRSRRGGRL